MADHSSPTNQPGTALIEIGRITDTSKPYKVKSTHLKLQYSRIFICFGICGVIVSKIMHLLQFFYFITFTL